MLHSRRVAFTAHSERDAFARRRIQTHYVTHSRRVYDVLHSLLAVNAIRRECARMQLTMNADLDEYTSMQRNVTW